MEIIEFFNIELIFFIFELIIFTILFLISIAVLYIYKLDQKTKYYKSWAGRWNL